MIGAITSSRFSIAVWALVGAIFLEDFGAMRWWHPYCNSQADGPGYYAIGIPFPYAEPTGASSMDFAFLPVAYLANILVIALVLAIVIGTATKWFGARSTLIERIALAAGFLSLALVSALAIAIGSASFRSAASLSYSDSYWSHRPAILVERMGVRPCSGSWTERNW